MRKLSPGDIAAKLNRISASNRSRRWKRAARQHLMQDVGGYLPPNGHTIEIGRESFVCIKRRYPTAGAAMHALATTHLSSNPERAEIRAYRCWKCRAFHLTSMEYQPND